MNDDLLPVHLTVRNSDGAVSVRLLLETPVGTGLVDGEGYTRIGQVREALISERNQFGITTRKRGWSWFYDEEEWGSGTGFEPTKARAVAALLREGGYIEAPPNTTNQGLW